ncbi:glycoside hydrolase family 18 protein [Kitasatospora purpeofusca]|uniref:glycoside hydrolase family 18 protein n=1 Tax=Kitasatospora purpeofusca TaxID=67352 RepID=UPI002258E178|nr:glycoside hydrolase family 18 protein [Kitasatospora purpeofusca]MCX4757542.1 glycoside hydrolase family 18 protein [Kitasatospora purpeofusca]WSR34736.1 glycoside hydrolase family 18 protein [Kitasatospora purpeofusca]WSR42945.1 glycoside hydrolase family 18 protein [Kitasatospora purpeofusca]
MRHRLSTRSTFGAATVAVLALLAPLAPAAAAADLDGAGDSARHGGAAYKRVGYFIQWGIYARNFHVKDLETSGTAGKLSHINYAFGNVGPAGTCQIGGPGSDGWADYVRPVGAEEAVNGVADTDGQALAGNFNQLRELKAKHPELKVMISLGGWSGSAYFSDAVRTEAGRKALVSSCIDLYLKGNLPEDGVRGGAGAAAGIFDGIDLDWEWPGSEGNPGNGIRPEDKQNFTKLVHEFRTQVDAYGRTLKGRKHFELSAYVPTAPAKIDAGFEVSKIIRDFDFVNLQGYDFHVSGEKTTAQQSALYSRNDFSLDGTVDAWLRRGAPARKLVTGLPFYGQGWTGVTGGGNGLGQPAAGPAPATWTAGTEDYKALKKLADSGTYKLYRGQRNGHAWLFDGTTLWTYDDATVLRTKAEYVRREGLGGAMIWSLDGDTPNGELITAIDKGLSRR